MLAGALSGADHRPGRFARLPRARAARDADHKLALRHEGEKAAERMRQQAAANDEELRRATARHHAMQRIRIRPLS